jgi:hypothetical protein
MGELRDHLHVVLDDQEIVGVLGDQRTSAIVSWFRRPHAGRRLVETSSRGWSPGDADFEVRCSPAKVGHQLVRLVETDHSNTASAFS